MKLIVKFNLVLFLVFAIGFAAVGYFANRLLQRNAKEEIMENARIMMEAALAVRSYTSTQIKPLLETQIKYSFLPQIVPAYSANQYFGQLHKKFPEYSYKEATLNPTNPMNRANDWEADIVNVFRQSPDLSEQVHILYSYAAEYAAILCGGCDVDAACPRRDAPVGRGIEHRPGPAQVGGPPAVTHGAIETIRGNHSVGPRPGS